MFKKTLHLHTAIFFMTIILHQLKRYDGILVYYILIWIVLILTYFFIRFLYWNHQLVFSCYIVFQRWNTCTCTGISSCSHVYMFMVECKGLRAMIFFFIIKYRLSHLYHEYIYWYIFELLQSKKVKCHAVYPSLWKKTYR